MAGKRKKQSGKIAFGQLIKVVLLISLIGGAALGYVWQVNQIDRLSAQRRDREIYLIKLKRENDELRRQISDLNEPVKLMRRVSEMQLGLAMRDESKVVRLEEPRANPPENNNLSRQFTQRSVNGVAR